MNFTTRAKHKQTEDAHLRRWNSDDGRYSIIEIKSTLGLGTRYVAAERLPNGNEYVLSRNRKRTAAERAIEKHERKQRRSAHRV